jgi:hypothetical protein
MPNIADVMLNKQLDELASMERTLSRAAADLPEAGDVTMAWYLGVEAEAARLRGICRRGLMRCYPFKSPQAIDEMLQVALWVNR